MQIDYIINELSRNQMVFGGLFESVSERIYLWRPATDKWCLLEILCHLYDEEREDFRARAKHCLESPELPFQSIDPTGWVKSRKYIEQSYQMKLNSFIEEREQSIAWLRSLHEPDWQQSHDHPNLGKMSAELFLHNWIAHDYIHIRQILKLRFAYLTTQTSERLDYAGDW